MVLFWPLNFSFPFSGINWLSAAAFGRNVQQSRMQRHVLPDPWDPRTREVVGTRGGDGKEMRVGSNSTAAVAAAARRQRRSDGVCSVVHRAAARDLATYFLRLRRRSVDRSGWSCQWFVAASTARQASSVTQLPTVSGQRRRNSRCIYRLIKINRHKHCRQWSQWLERVTLNYIRILPTVQDVTVV